MAIAVGVNDKLDPTVLSSSNTSGTGNNAQDLQNQFLTMLVTQLKTRIQPIQWITASSPRSWHRSIP